MCNFLWRVCVEDSIVKRHSSSDKIDNESQYKVTLIDMNVLFQCAKTSHDQRDDWGNSWMSISHSNTCWHQRWLHSKNWVHCRWQYSFYRVMTSNNGDDTFSRDDLEWCQWLLVEQWDQEMTSNNDDDLLGTNHFETMTILFCTDDLNFPLVSIMNWSWEKKFNPQTCFVEC